MEYREYKIDGQCSNCYIASSQKHLVPIDIERITVGCKGCGLTVILYLPSQGRHVAYKGYGLSVEIHRQ